MKKSEFVGWLEKAEVMEDGDLNLRVDWGCISRELERAVFLHGVWGKGCITTIQLYQPTPGRQGQDCYMAANHACEEATKKYQQWLDEWLANSGKG